MKFVFSMKNALLMMKRIFSLTSKRILNAINETYSLKIFFNGKYFD